MRYGENPYRHHKARDHHYSHHVLKYFHDFGRLIVDLCIAGIRHPVDGLGDFAKQVPGFLGEPQ